MSAENAGRRLLGEVKEESLEAVSFYVSLAASREPFRFGTTKLIFFADFEDCSSDFSV